MFFIQEVSKLKEQVPTVALELESILGTNSDSIRGSLMFALSSEEMLYYSSEYFIVLNLISKESVVIKREGCFNHTVLYINRFKYDSKTDIVFTIERGNNQLYVLFQRSRWGSWPLVAILLRPIEHSRRPRRGDTVGGPVV